MEFRLSDKIKKKNLKSVLDASVDLNMCVMSIWCTHVSTIGVFGSVLLNLSSVSFLKKGCNETIIDIR